MLSYNVIDFPVFLGKGNSKIAPGEITQVEEVLGADWLIQTVPGFEVSPNSLGYGSIIQEGIAWHIMHGEEGGCSNKPDGNNPLEQALYYI